MRLCYIGFILTLYLVYGVKCQDLIENNATIEDNIVNLSNRFADFAVILPPNSEKSRKDKVCVVSEEEHIHLCDCINYQCVRKCCESNEVYVEFNNTQRCERKTIDFQLKIFNGTKEFVDHNRNFHFISNNKCRKRPLPEKEPFFLQPDGKLFTEHKLYELHDYCIDITTFKDGRSPIVEPLVCFNETMEEEGEGIYVKKILLSAGMILSVPFLLATFLVYALIPELRNLHGKSLMCHVASLMFAYVFLASAQLDTVMSDPVCDFTAFMIQFFFLVSFFWLNVMCFDIWWTFSGFRGFKGSKQETEHKKFFIYCLYAWGLPLLILSVTIFMQYYPHIPYQLERPGFGEVNCWFHDTTSILIYFYGPLVTITACNIVLFAITAFKIIKIKSDTNVLYQGNNRRHDKYEHDKQRYNLYLKLFIVMGVNWAFEVLSFFVQGSDWIWIISDLLNTLQGVLIFIIFVCKRNVWKLLQKRFYGLTENTPFRMSSSNRTQDSHLSTSSRSNDTVRKP